MADFIPKFVDLVRNTTSTQGTGNFTLGPAVNGFTSFAAAVQAGESFYYSATNLDKPAEREVGRGTMLANGTISRTPISGAKTNFSSGTKTVSLTAAAEWFAGVQAGAGAGAGGSAISVAGARSALAALAPGAGKLAMLTEAGREGVFVYDGADLSALVAADTAQGVLVAPASDPSGASGAWSRRFDGPLDPRWFGLKGDGASDNLAAFNALHNYLRATAQQGAHPSYRGGQRIHFPKGRFYFSAPLSLKLSLVIEGESSWQQDAPATWLDFATGGFVIERYNTLGGAAENPATTGADGTILRNLYLSSRQARPSAANYASQARDGILALARVVVEGCRVAGFTRDGIHIESGALSGVGDTNSNGSVVRDCALQLNGRDGLFVDGVDSNACRFENIDTDYNGRWGIYDSGFLANSHAGHHASANGLANLHTIGGKGDSLSSLTVFPATGGTAYYVNPGQAAAASNTQPGTNSAVWVPIAESAGLLTADTNSPAWVSGMNWKEGGSYFNSGITPAVWLNCYTETGQGQPYINAPSMMQGGTWERNPNVNGAFVDADENGKLRLARGIKSLGAVDIAPVADSGLLTIGAASGHFYPFISFQPDGGAAGSGPRIYGHPDVLFATATTHRFKNKADSATFAEINSGGLSVTGTITATGAVSGANLSGTNSGDQTSIVGITGTIAQFNAALSDGDFATGGGTATGTNSGDQFTSITSSRILGRTSAGFGPAEVLTGPQVTGLLDAFTPTAKGLAPASGGGTANFLRADGTWAAPASGGLSDGDKGDVVVSGSGSTLAVESATPPGGIFTATGESRFTNGADATLKLSQISGTTYLEAFNLDRSARRAFTLGGSGFNLQVNANNVLTVNAGSVQAVGTLSVAADASGLLEVGRFGTGINAIVRPGSSAPGLALRSPDNVDRITITNSAVTVAHPLSASNLSGTNTGDQTITLTGDVSGSGTGSFAATIGAGAVTYAKIQNVSAASRLLGRASAGAGVVEELGLAGGLAVSGTNLTLGAITPTSVAATGAVTSSAGGVGYASGAGGAVTQVTSKTTGVTVNSNCGRITMHNGSLAANAMAAFTVTNSTVVATDTVNLNLQSGNAAAGAYRYWVDKVSAGSFVIVVENRSGGALSEALAFNFAVLKAVNA